MLLRLPAIKSLKTNSILVIVLVFSWIDATLAAIEVIDDNGSTISLQRPAHRIISLAPSHTELVYAAGAGRYLVAVVEYSNYPPEARDLPIIGRHDMLDMERIVALQPDLIVAWRSGNPAASLQKLKDLGYNVYVAEPQLLNSIPHAIENISTLAGTQETGYDVARSFRQGLEQLRERYQNLAPVSVFYQLWNAPLITVGKNQLINDIIELCGGQNIFSHLSLAPKINEEAVIVADPEVIIASGMDIARPEWLDHWRKWSSLRAVKNQHLYFIPPDLVQRHSPRALLGSQQMCRHIDKARF